MELTYFYTCQTSAATMTQITYRLLKNRTAIERLQNELDKAFPDPTEEMTLAKLEPLPFLVFLPKLFTFNKLSKLSANVKN